MAEPRIPYHFAKAKGVVCLGVEDQVARIVVRDDASPLTLSEVRRVFALPLRTQMVGTEAFDTYLAQVYSRSDQQAAAVIEDVEQVLDEVIFMRYGQLVLYTSVDNIREEKGKSVDAYFREVFAC